MNADNFEKQLQRQPMREIPPEWREEILSAARQSLTHPASRTPHHSRPSTLSHKLSAIFWPHPKAWAGLAALWLLIFGAQFATRDGAEVVARKPEPPSPQMITALQQQKRLLAELIGPTTPPQTDRPKPAGIQPQSYRRKDLLFA